MTTTCKKCRQPLLLAGQDTTLPSGSALEVLSNAVSNGPLFVPPTRRTVVGHASTASSHAYTPSQPPVRVTRPRAVVHPAESFVFLGESVLAPARQQQQLQQQQQQAAQQPQSSPDSTAEEGHDSLSRRLHQLDELNRALSASTGFDHPLCGECIESLLTLMNRELDDCKRERDRLLLFERDTQKRKEEGSFSKEQAEKDIAKLSKAEVQAVDELLSLERSKNALEAERAALDEEEAQLEREEEQSVISLPRPHSIRFILTTIFVRFCQDYAAYVLESQLVAERTRALQRQYDHDEAELKRLQQTNVYSRSCLFRCPAIAPLTENGLSP